ncbi:Sapep family Mn(2+)-dependent dipeptidase [Spiroplasma alleghenense]|uniref:Dipeptidase PepV n=1 Tax=Spiroplasma alleghenense TaxID=216931 RepID=A0A345Z4C9_9MOLU|nr:Sapep family Mn(2+)-dependent dipeptidase [Spiroplasma alleghenense]AXK51458.1 dipeptidase PepV [Spiroplasma alleghenense]
MFKVDSEILKNQYFPKAIETLKECIRIPSFRQESKPNQPFGVGVSKVLDFIIKNCNDLGFKTKVAKDFKYGYADYGDGEKLLAILCHLDVVPPGNLEEWKADPFDPTISDGILFGRGSLDDKGPTIMNIYAVKYLMDNNFIPDYKIRLVFGLSEETTWECMQSYVANEQLADIGYTPDGQFPLVYAEKWILDCDLIGTQKIDYEILGGEAYNVVNDIVTYKGPKIPEISKYLTKNKINHVVQEESLVVKGTSAHGSLPERGVNAGTWLFKAMFESGINDVWTNLIANQFHNNFQLEQIFGDQTDESGMLTANIGILDFKNNSQRLTFNFRVPVHQEVEKDVIEKFQKYIKPLNLDYKTVAIEPRVFMSKESSLVKKIMSVYQEVTGDLKTQPAAIGGGTFAKSMPNVVAFGAEFDLENSSMHAYNESIKVEELEKMLEIYTKSLVKLAKF